MKIIATSDTHGNLDRLDFTGYDIAVIAGDFAPLNGFSINNIKDQVKWFHNTFIPFITRFKTTQFCIIPGNHDLFLDSYRISSLYPGIDFKISTPDNVHILIDTSIDIHGMKVYGTPWVPIINYRWAFETDGINLRNRFKSIPNGIDILITHTPPHIGAKCNIDRSTQYGISMPFGSIELSDAIFESKPKYVFCGHIHSGLHDECEFNGSRIYNVSRVNEDYEIAYEPRIIEI